MTANSWFMGVHLGQSASLAETDPEALRRPLCPQKIAIQESKKLDERAAPKNNSPVAAGRLPAGTAGPLYPA